MKGKKITIVSTILIVAFCAVLVSVQGYVGPSNELGLSVRSSKRVFRLGEVVSTEVTMTNKSSTKIDVSASPCIKIALNGESDYKLYVPQLYNFQADGLDIPLTIKAKETLRIQRAVLWNYKPNVAHLNADAAKPYLAGRILSDYAFADSGTYLIKACIGILKGGTWKIQESEPIEITIEEPAGDDLTVWNKIKDNGEFAHLLQEGDMTRGYKKPEDRLKFRQEVEQTLTDYPNSFYAQPLRQSLDKLKANEAEKQQFFQKM